MNPSPNFVPNLLQPFLAGSVAPKGEATNTQLVPLLREPLLFVYINCFAKFSDKQKTL